MTSEEGSTPILSLDGERADIRLNRPRKLNRIEPADLAALDRHLDTIENDPRLRVVVFTGSGRVFGAGYHIGDLDEQHSGARTPTGAEIDFETVANRLEHCPLPTICALNGSVYGGSTDLALACDFRIGITGTEMVMPAARLGTHYYRGGIERYVTRLGLGAAKRLFMAAIPPVQRRHGAHRISRRGGAGRGAGGACRRPRRPPRRQRPARGAQHETGDEPDRGEPARRGGVPGRLRGVPAVAGLPRRRAGLEGETDPGVRKGAESGTAVAPRRNRYATSPSTGSSPSSRTMARKRATAAPRALGSRLRNTMDVP